MVDENQGGIPPIVMIRYFFIVSSQLNSRLGPLGVYYSRVDQKKLKGTILEVGSPKSSGSHLSTMWSPQSIAFSW